MGGPCVILEWEWNMGKGKKYMHGLRPHLLNLSTQLSHLPSLRPLPWGEENKTMWMVETV